MDVFRHSRTVHPRRNKFVPFIVVVKWELTSSPVFAGFSLYKMITTSALGNSCATQIDWMLPYFSMSVAVTILCTVVILYRTVMGPSIGRRTRRLWIKVIVESSLLFAVGPIIFLVAYITSDVRTGCPLPVLTMIMVSFSSVCFPPGC